MRLHPCVRRGRSDGPRKASCGRGSAQAGAERGASGGSGERVVLDSPRPLSAHGLEGARCWRGAGTGQTRGPPSHELDEFGSIIVPGKTVFLRPDMPVWSLRSGLIWSGTISYWITKRARASSRI
ncbi:hypothetical protein BS78_07G150100 [Paspalum vaginatum]|nr:hypothetical protein BS78_07G150100 [Paspalum vaginatum]